MNFVTNETPLFTVDVSKKNWKSRTDGYVTQNIDLSTSVRFGTLDIPAHFNSMFVYIVNHKLETLTTTDKIPKVN